MTAYLDAPQLVKHMLGLTIGFGPAGFDFVYLYYEVSSPEAKKHRKELEEFKKFWEPIVDKIVVRRAKKGEKILTIDSEERALSENILVISDKNRAIQQ